MGITPPNNHYYYFTHYHFTHYQSIAQSINQLFHQTTNQSTT